MSAAQINVTGVSSVVEALKTYGAEVARGVEQAVMATALEALTDVRKAIQGPPKTGRTYKRGKKVHQASAPGEAPATDLGALVSSTYITRIDAHTAAIGSRLPYAFFLEFGTLKVKPRPSWTPAAERAAPRLEKRIARVIAQAKARAEVKTK